MYKSVLNEIEAVVAVLEKGSLAPLLLSDPFRKMIGSNAEDILKCLVTKDKQLTKDKILALTKGSPYQFSAEVKDGRIRKSMEFTVARDSSDNFLIHVKDVTEIKKLEYLLKSYSSIVEKQEKQLYKIAHLDALTGIPNRRAIYEHFSKYLEESNITNSSICMIDIDHFKQFNDRFGHEFGDHVLKYLSQQVLSDLDEECFLSRIGGEEFCLFSRNRSGFELTTLVDGILDNIKNKDIVTPTETVIQVSFSAGVAEYGKDGTTLNDLLRKADKALYYAKATGRSKVISFSTELFEKRDDTLIPRSRLISKTGT